MRSVRFAAAIGAARPLVDVIVIDLHPSYSALNQAIFSEADRIHLLAEVTKAAYYLRDAYFCDPEQHPVDVAGFLSEERAARTRAAISMERALPDAMDLMVTCVEAGLGLDSAIARVSEEMQLSSPPLADQLTQTFLAHR